MREKTTTFQSTRFLIWTLVLLNILLIVMPANAAPAVDVRKAIIDEARHTSVPVSLVMAVIRTESGFRPDQEGADGARGLMQILPGTAENLGLDPGSLWQARANIRAGLDILEGHLAQHNGHWRPALLAYGAHRRSPNSIENHRYVTAVLKAERQFAEQYAALAALSEDPGEAPMGHDDWGSAATPQMAGSLPPQAPQETHQRFERRDTGDDLWGPAPTAETEQPVSGLEIVIYEIEQMEPRWQPIRRAGSFRSVRNSQWRGPNRRHHAASYGGQRAEGRGRFNRQGDRW